MSVATASSPQADHLLTAEDLWQHGPAVPGELVKGRFIEMPPTGHPHASVEGNVARELGNFVKQHALGKVMTGEVGIITQRHPDTVRGADVVYISNERLVQAQADGYLDVPPELAIEVVSPNDRWTEIDEKVNEYLACGVQAVWIIDPRTRRVSSYRPPDEMHIYGPDDVIEEPELLPGFALSVRELFE
ncbi:MAG: Uma2 family endonuclease [Thiohalocapsa sp.]|uniref:Uma2 family endonuclease n=1 Tax=Thiohalocapsa sp. TaxID=2497641 RepID=UPI0025E8343E|nr:Uma2 family endonuclease [Thiohalocapsa sp.]MCG6939685.1 Uma2 family endonuclease [Thiohalocapsa sp.]